MTGPAALSCAALAVCVGAVGVAAQQVQPDSGATASLEVASIKPNTRGTSGGGPPLQPNGSYSATNVALKSVIANAYEVSIFQVEGGPAWLTSDRFDIVARGTAGTRARLRPAMLRTRSVSNWSRTLKRKSSRATHSS